MSDNEKLNHGKLNDEKLEEVSAGLADGYIKNPLNVEKIGNDLQEAGKKFKEGCKRAKKELGKDFKQLGRSFTKLGDKLSENKSSKSK